MRPSKEERIKYNADYPPDTEFSAYARLLQSKWRESKGYPQGKLGNYLETDFAKASKSNFLTEKIGALVTQEIVNARKNKGLIGEPRIWNNLLSSQPLCFNLFGELYDNLVLATSYFKRLFPSKVEKVNEVKFEYSPGRGNQKYTADHSAFDVFIEYSSGEKRGFIGIEVKYAESLREETIEKANKNFRLRYAELTDGCQLFNQQYIEQLKAPPLSQIWRDHLLSIATKQDYDEGFFIFLFPSKNEQCQSGVDKYMACLQSADEDVSGFCPRHLEDFIEVLVETVNTDWAKELKERYVGSEND